MGVKVTNNAFGTISAGINSSATTVTLDSGQGARFPTLGGSDHFYGTLIDTSNNVEIIKVTARSTDSMTVVRAQDNTTARAFSIGDRFELRPTAKLFEDIQSDALIDNSVPDQSSHSGKFLTTDGTNVSWASAGSTSASDLTSGTLPSARLPNGSVVKVSSFITNSSTSISGVSDDTSYSNITNLSGLSHTMVDSTNQLLVFYMINWSGGGGTNAAIRFRILDGSSNIAGTGTNWIGQQTNMADSHSRSRASQISGCVNYDPDASSVTLNAQINAPVGGGGVKVNGNYNNDADSEIRSTITIVEYVA
mgnify:CR=1 FL=1